MYPTASGRQASLVATVDTEAAAWQEVLALSPDAAMPGMYEQFVCHWELAELGRPERPVGISSRGGPRSMTAR